MAKKRIGGPTAIDIDPAQFLLAAYHIIRDPTWRANARTDIIEGFHLASPPGVLFYHGCKSEVLPLLDKLEANPTEAEANAFTSAIHDLAPTFAAIAKEGLSIGRDGIALYVPGGEQQVEQMLDGLFGGKLFGVR